MEPELKEQTRMKVIDLQFPVIGERLPADHGYDLYSALSRLVPELHGDDFPLHIGPVSGTYVGQGMLQLDPRLSRLRLRLPADAIPLALPLSGKALNVSGQKLRLGVPQVRALVPAPSLIARMVVIKASSPRRDPADKHSRDCAATKRYLAPVEFLEAINRDLQRRAINAKADLPLHESGARKGQPRRHVVRIHGKTIVGFTVVVQGLTAEESIRVQEEGLGGRGKMGCGFFGPMKEDRQ
jgi:hypothetical protein